MTAYQPDPIVLATLYSDSMTEAEQRHAEAVGGVELSATALVAVAEYVAQQTLVAYGIDPGTGARAGEDPDLAHPTHNGQPIDPMLNVVALLVEQVGRVADNLAGSDVHVTVEDVQRAWDSIGIRLDVEYATDFVKALPGVTLDE